jgi:uncharacterized protein YggU (UPF0235/DUF167 family)
MAYPWRRVAGGLEIALRVIPKSRSNEVTGLRGASDGPLSLALKVRALPDKGAANKAALDLLAEALGVPKSGISLLSGSTKRNKTVLVRGEPQQIEGLLKDLLGRCAREGN